MTVKIYMLVTETRLKGRSIFVFMEIRTFSWQAVSEYKGDILGSQAIGNNGISGLVLLLTKDLINKTFLKSDISGFPQLK